MKISKNKVSSAKRNQLKFLEPCKTHICYQIITCQIITSTNLIYLFMFDIT